MAAGRPANFTRIIRRIAVTIGLILLWALIVLAVAAAEANWFPEPDIERGKLSSIENHLVRELSDAAENERLGSASLVLVQNGRIAAKHGFGVADTETRAPVLADRTLYQTASVSKAVTAWGVMKLVEEGKIALDDPVMRYLTRWRFPGSGEHRGKVTTRHLLTHTAGIDEGTGLRGFLPGETMQTLEEALSSTDSSTAGEPYPVRVVREPGNSMDYGNANYAILQLLIEEVTHQQFSDYMRESVLHPLGMANSGFGMDVLAAEGRERDLAPNFDGRLNVQPRRQYPATAAVALYATA